MTKMLGIQNPIPLRRPRIEELAWVQCQKRLKTGEVIYPVGRTFKGDEILQIFKRAENFWGLVQQRAITYGLGVMPAPQEPKKSAGTHMIIVNAGFGKHDVIEGRVVSKGLTKKDALALAGMPAEKAKGESAKAPEMPAEPVADKKTNEAA